MTRAQLELSNGDVRELEAVIAAQGMKERQEAVARALHLLEWAVRERQSGRHAKSAEEKSDRYRALLLPALVPDADTATPAAEGVPVEIRHKA